VASFARESVGDIFLWGQTAGAGRDGEDFRVILRRCGEMGGAGVFFFLFKIA
jgi:hypothetical protein